MGNETSRQQITEEILKGNYKLAQLLRDELEATEKAERLQAAQEIVNDRFDEKDFLQNGDHEAFRAYVWQKVKNHEVLSPLDRLKFASLQRFEADLQKANRLLDGDIEKVLGEGV